MHIQPYQKCCLTYATDLTTLHNSFSMAMMHEGCRMWIDFFKANFRKILAKHRSHHLCNFRIDRFCEYASVGTYVFDEFVQTWPFHFFAFYVRDRIIKIEENAALLQLFDEDRTLLRGRCIWKAPETQVFKNQKSVETKIIFWTSVPPIHHHLMSMSNNTRNKHEMSWVLARVGWQQYKVDKQPLCPVSGWRFIPRISNLGKKLHNCEVFCYHYSHFICTIN